METEPSPAHQVVLHREHVIDLDVADIGVGFGPAGANPVLGVTGEQRQRVNVGGRKEIARDRVDQRLWNLVVDERLAGDGSVSIIYLAERIIKLLGLARKVPDAPRRGNQRAQRAGGAPGTARALVVDEKEETVPPDRDGESAAAEILAELPAAWQAGMVQA